jgi:ribose 5-phosphate isomerase B
MKIFLATDHAGFALKEKVKGKLKSLGYTVHDEGAFVLDDGDDYPDFIRVAAKQVASNPEEDRAIVFGGSGEGEAMVANRYKGVRATVFYGGNEEIIVRSREHNNANILSIGAKFVSEEEAFQVIELWLNTAPAHDPRHLRRIAKIDELIKEENEF